MITTSSYITKLISRTISTPIFRDYSLFSIVIITLRDLLASIGISLFSYKALPFPFKTSIYIVPLGFVEA